MGIIMCEDNHGDLRISGSGSTAGGNYRHVRISGSGKVTGDIDCEDFVVNGSGEVSGELHCDRLRISGSGSVRGDVRGGELKVSGSAKFEAAVGCESLTVSGSADIREGLDAQQVRINGSARIGGDCNAENFESEGKFVVDGLLSADDIDITLSWHRSRAKEIGGARISVRQGHFGAFKNILTLGAAGPSLEADTIEGDEIALENTVARVVRGNNVTIGNGCTIDLVEYRGTLRKVGEPKVAEEKKI